MIPFLDQQDPSYSVMANGRPVGEIRESDLTEADPHTRHAMFIDPAFPKGIVQAASQLGVDKVLGDLNLRYYANLVTQSQADAAAKTAVQADLEEAFQTRAASLKQNFINNVLLAVQASNKNVFVQNPLRDAIRKNFRGAGLPDAVVVDLFEDAVQTAGADYFLAMVEKADEWLGFEKEAMAQIETVINEANYSHPADRGMEIEADLTTEAPRQYSAPQTVAAPVQHAAAHAPVVAQAAPVASAQQGNQNWNADEMSVRDILRQASTQRKGMK